MKPSMSMSLKYCATIALLFNLAPAQASLLPSQQEGVRCKDGYTATISNSNKTLVCSKANGVRREVICSPVLFKGDGDINLNSRIELVDGGSSADTCRVPGTNKSKPANAFLPLPGDPALDSGKWTRHTVNGGKDYYSRADYSFPERGPIYNPLHDASKGVSCPSGFDGDSMFSGKGIRCDKYTETKSASCDFGWSISIDHNNGDLDRCLGLNIGNTVPQGLTNAQLQIEKARGDIGWVLDERNGRDQWKKKVYDWPQSRD